MMSAQVAIIGPAMQAVILAAPIRRAGISVETYLSGSFKRQMQKASGAECAVLVTADRLVVKDLWTGRQKGVSPGSVCDEVREVLVNGYYDPDETFGAFVQRMKGRAA